MSCALVLDIDGTTVPSQISGRTTALDVAGHGHPVIANRILNLVSAHPSPMLWLSSWGTDAREALEPIIGPVTVLSPAQVGDPGAHWWKTQALTTWVGSHPEVTTLIWADDELTGHAGDVAALVEFAALQHMEVALLDTGATGGLTDGHLKQILHRTTGRQEVTR